MPDGVVKTVTADPRGQMQQLVGGHAVEQVQPVFAAHPEHARIWMAARSGRQVSLGVLSRKARNAGNLDHLDRNGLQEDYTWAARPETPWRRAKRDQPVHV
jgi:hypothetical protein